MTGFEPRTSEPHHCPQILHSFKTGSGFCQIKDFFKLSIGHHYYASEMVKRPQDQKAKWVLAVKNFATEKFGETKKFSNLVICSKQKLLEKLSLSCTDMWCGSCNTASNTVETAKFTYRKEAGNDPLKTKIKQKVVVNCPFIYKEALRFKCVAFGKSRINVVARFSNETLLG